MRHTNIVLAWMAALLLGGCGTFEGLNTTSDPRGESEDSLATGFWRLNYARTAQDTCFGGGLEGTLPNGFQVVGGVDTFEIEAVDYATPGPITCRLDGVRFTCEEQRSQIADGYIYKINFSGTLLDFQTIQGQARVFYEASNSETADYLEEIGVDISTCSSVLLMELTWADWYDETA